MKNSITNVTLSTLVSLVFVEISIPSNYKEPQCVLYNFKNTRRFNTTTTTLLIKSTTYGHFSP